MTSVYNVYTDKSLEYMLNPEEVVIIDKVFDFVNKFNFVSITLAEYRTKLINDIQKTTRLDEFIMYEKIAEKLLWNLKSKTKHLYKDLSDCVNCVYELSESGLASALDKFYEDNSYRSFINKLVLIDDVNNKIYHRKMEGSAHIFEKNEFNLKLWIALNDKKTYELIMFNPSEITKLELPVYYFSSDYGFPNLNFGRPFIQSDKFRNQESNVCIIWIIQIII